VPIALLSDVFWAFAGSGKTTAIHVLSTALAALKQQQQQLAGSDDDIDEASRWADLSIISVNPAAVGPTALLGGFVKSSAGSGHTPAATSVPASSKPTGPVESSRANQPIGAAPLTVITGSGGDAAVAGLASSVWVDGVVTRKMRQLTATAREDAEVVVVTADNKHWLVLDGPLDAAITESVHGLLRYAAGDCTNVHD
jgi:hypothetical protein